MSWRRVMVSSNRIQAAELTQEPPGVPQRVGKTPFCLTGR